MPFSELTVLAAWARSGGFCECKEEAHAHEGGCKTRLLWTLQRGQLVGGWWACRKVALGKDSLENCQIKCVECATDFISARISAPY